VPIEAFPPQLVGDGPLWFTSNTILQNFYTVKYGGAVWTAFMPDIAGLIVIHRSFDGNIWETVDAANGWNPEYQAESDYDDAAHRWWFINVNAARTQISVRYFDLTTGLWSGIVTSFAVTGGVVERANVIHRSGSSLTVMWTIDNGINERRIWFNMYNGTTWSGPTQITEFLSSSFNQRPELSAGTVDASGATHSFVWARTDPFVLNTVALYHVRIAGGGTYAWSTVLTGQDTNTSFRYALAAYKPDTDEIILPGQFRTAPTGPWAAGMLRGTPSSAPAFTVEYAVNPYNGNGDPMLVANQDGGYSVLALVWLEPDSLGNMAQTVWKSENTGSGWGTPELVWSQETDPAEEPAEGTLDQMEAVWPTLFPDGTKGYWLGWISTGAGGSSKKTVFYMEPVIAPPPEGGVFPYSYLGRTIAGFSGHGGPYSVLAFCGRVLGWNLVSTDNWARTDPFVLNCAKSSFQRLIRALRGSHSGGKCKLDSSGARLVSSLQFSRGSAQEQKVVTLDYLLAYNCPILPNSSNNLQA
jgi:hypothetical protein